MKLRMIGTTALALTVVAGTLTAAPASAQRQRDNRQVIQLPPPPLGSRSLGLIEQDFQRMRATSPDPNNFMHGRWNPQYQVINPPKWGYHPGTPSYGGGGHYYQPYPYYGYYPQYPAYGGGYGGSFGGGFGGGYGGGLGGYFGYNLPGRTVEREVVIIREPRTDGPALGPAPGTRPERSRDEFYLQKPQGGESLGDALDDIRKAWLNGDGERLKNRFKADGKVRIYPKGQYQYSVGGKDFTGMLQDALKQLDTIAFEFDAPKADDGARAFATGRHTFVDAEKKRQTTYVSYTLERTGSRWFITEAGSATAPIAKHQD